MLKEELESLKIELKDIESKIRVVQKKRINKRMEELNIKTGDKIYSCSDDKNGIVKLGSIGYKDEVLIECNIVNSRGVTTSKTFIIGENDKIHKL